jgi:hypothetical protein
MWSQVKGAKGSHHEEELQRMMQHMPTALGCRMVRFEKTHESAWSFIRQLLLANKLPFIHLGLTLRRDTDQAVIPSESSIQLGMGNPRPSIGLSVFHSLLLETVVQDRRRRCFSRSIDPFVILIAHI